jgi:uncharacterized membrane protein
MPIWLFLVILPILLIAAWILYRRDRRLVAPARGLVLSMLRAVLVTACVTLLLDLADIDQRTEIEEEEVLVVLDVSPSMALSDGDGVSRIREATRVVQSPAFDALERKFRVSFHALDAGLREIDAAEVGTLDAIGRGTDLGQPIVDAILERPRDSVGAVILFSDGNHNGARDPREAARALGRLGVPLINIGVGPLDPPPDLALVGIDATGEVFAGDEIEIEVTIDNRGLDVELLPIHVLDGESEVASFVIQNLPSRGASRWPLRFKIEAPGRHRLEVSIDAVPGEATTENNRRSFWLDVLSHEARVLHIDGTPRWEYRYLRDTWERDERIALDSFLVAAPPDRRLPSDFPRERAALLAYDVIVLGDIEPELFTRDEQQTLVDFVRARGGTLVVLSGPRSMPYAWSSTPLADVLPVELHAETPGREDGVSREAAAERFVLSAVGEESSLLRLVAGRESNVKLWELLPGPFWVQPTRGVREGSTLLASTHREKTPVFVTRSLGSGRVFYSGIDSTWRWRFRFGDLLYTRFWGQVVRWAVAERLSARDEHVQLGTDRAVYDADDDVRIAVVVTDANDDPIVDGRVDAVVTTRVPASSKTTRAHVRRVSLSLVPRSDGRYEGSLSSRELGELVADALDAESASTTDTLEMNVQIEVESLPDYAIRTERATVNFAVDLPETHETTDLASHRALLEDLAGLSGGDYLPIERSDEALALLPSSERTRVVTNTKAAIDWPWTLALTLLGLLTLEWLLRKRWNLA